MQIKKVRVQNYQSFSDSGDQNITKLFALIGKNNSGKSAFINAIQSVLGDKKLTDSDIHKQCGDPIKISITIQDMDLSGKEVEQTEIVNEYKNGKSEYFINQISAKTIPTKYKKLLVIPAIRNPQDETTGGKATFLKDLLDAIVNLKAKDSPAITSFNEKPAGNLSLDEIRALLLHKTSIQLNEVGALVSSYFQNLLGDENQSISIVPDGDLSKAVKYSTKIKDPILCIPDGIDIMKCGTGLQSIAILALLQTYADLQEKSDSILLIEEPEVYLHPELQRKMFSVLKDIAKKTQVIFATHSPIMISDLWGNSVRLVLKQQGQSVISEINIQGVVRELGIRYEDVLNPKVVIFVEGIGDVSFYKRIIELKYPALAQNLDINIKFIDTGGFDTIHAYALMHILLSLNVETQFYILTDSDGKSTETKKAEILKRISERIEKKSLTIKQQKYDDLHKFIKPLSKYAIESYLLDYELIKRLDENIKENDFNDFLVHYEACLPELLKKMNTNSFRSFKPKLLFEEPKNQEHINIYENDFKNNKTFLKVRAQLVNAVASKRKSGISLMHCLLTEETIKRDILKEPIIFLDEIIEAVGLLSTPTKTVGLERSEASLKV